MRKAPGYYREMIRKELGEDPGDYISLSTPRKNNRKQQNPCKHTEAHSISPRGCKPLDFRDKREVAAAFRKAWVSSRDARGETADHIGACSYYR